MNQQNDPKGNASQAVQAGESSVTLGNLPVSVIQAIYHEITGNTETLSKWFRATRIVTKADLEQLCIKFEQISQQYHIAGSSTNFTVRHINGLTNQFSSLEKFLQYDENYPEQIANISIEFGFLIKNPMLNKHYDYKVEVYIESLDLSDDTQRAKRRSDEIFGPNSIYFNMSYVDYVVARTFLAAMEEWINGLEDLKPSALLMHLKRFTWPNSPWDPYARIVFAVSAMTGLYASYSIMPKAVDLGSLQSVMSFAFLAVAIYIATQRVVAFLYARIMEHIRNYQPPHFILINRGDKNNFNKFRNRNRSLTVRMLLFSANILLVLALNIASNRIYDLIK